MKFVHLGWGKVPQHGLRPLNLGTLRGWLTDGLGLDIWQWDILSAATEAGEASTTAAVLPSYEPGFWLSSTPPMGGH